MVLISRNSTRDKPARPDLSCTSPVQRIEQTVPLPLSRLRTGSRLPESEMQGSHACRGVRRPSSLEVDQMPDFESLPPVRREIFGGKPSVAVMRQMLAAQQASLVDDSLVDQPFCIFSDEAVRVFGRVCLPREFLLLVALQNIFSGARSFDST